jgi:hypothetical protein
MLYLSFFSIFISTARQTRGGANDALQGQHSPDRTVQFQETHRGSCRSDS